MTHEYDRFKTVDTINPIYRARYTDWKVLSWAMMFFLPFLFFGLGTFFFPDKSTGFTIFCIVMWCTSAFIIYDSLSTLELLVLPDRVVKRFRFAFHDQEVLLKDAKIVLFFARSWRLIVTRRDAGFLRKRMETLSFDFSYTDDPSGEEFKKVCESLGIVFEDGFGGYSSKDDIKNAY